MRLQFTKEWGIMSWIVYSGIIIACFVPYLIEIPFTINIFLTWEGAYRISQGQIPYYDFYLPLGVVHWILPGLLFTVFTPTFKLLVLYQSVINVFSLTLFYNILRHLRVKEPIRVLGILILYLSYVIYNFWPWYNNLVFVLQLGAITLVLGLFSKSQNNRSTVVTVLLASLVAILSFFTKQDTGAFTIIFCLFLLLYHDHIFKKKVSLIYLTSCFIFITAYTIPFIDAGFLDQFNLGQDPHSSRIRLSDLLNSFFVDSFLLKLYFITLIAIFYTNLRQVRIDKWRTYVSLFLGLFIILEAFVVQYTSYIPHYNHYYFHAFSVVIILHFLDISKILDTPFKLVVALALTSLLWLDSSWHYLQKLLPKNGSNDDVEVVGKHNFMKQPCDSIFDKKGGWVTTNKYPTISDIKLPPETLEGIDYLHELFGANPGINVLNMSELTFLQYEFNLTPPENIPLWFHKGVVLFDKDIASLCAQVRSGEYDVVIFESIPILNEFFPYDVQNCVLDNEEYKLVHTFRAPRRETNSYIKVYLRKKSLLLQARKPFIDIDRSDRGL